MRRCMMSCLNIVPVVDITILCELHSSSILLCVASLVSYYVFFFFFQAEDGIRDLTVTGVQTCALPISTSERRLVPISSLVIAALFTPAQSAAERYEPVFDGLRHMTQGERVAPIRNVTLRRDAIVFHLEDGNLFLATPVAGRTIGAVFVGRGSVSVTPPLAIERLELKRLLEDSIVDARISAAAFVFTDSTLTELERQLTFGPRPAANQGSGVLSDVVDRLVDGRRVVQPTLMRSEEHTSELQ